MDPSSTKSREKPFPGGLHLGLVPTVPGPPLGVHANAPPRPDQGEGIRGVAAEQRPPRHRPNAEHATAARAATCSESSPRAEVPLRTSGAGPSLYPGRPLWALVPTKLFLGAPLPRVFERLRIPVSPVTKVIFCFLILPRVGSPSNIGI